jgi:hypothetical protein
LGLPPSHRIGSTACKLPDQKNARRQEEKAGGDRGAEKTFPQTGTRRRLEEAMETKVSQPK